MSIYKIKLDANLQTSKIISVKTIAIYTLTIFLISCLSILLQ
jgi:hypothetical protein